MGDRHDPGSLDAVIASYLTSKYFTELAPGTQRMRRNLLNNVFAHVQRLSADGDRAVDGGSQSGRPAHQRRNWRTA